MHRSWTRAVDLDQWAARIIARQRFPALVRSLVWATTRGKTEFSFPADEGVQRTGWDGELMVELGNVWVPAGKSLWELSVGEDPEAKADQNYAKRTKKTKKSEATKTAFVFVTPRKWPGRKKWANAKKKKGIWHDVRVLDSDDLEHWLEQAPAVDAWVAREMGRLPSGVMSLAHAWTETAALTKPPLTPSVFLAGREKTAETLRARFAGEPAEIALAALSAKEVIDFVAAVFGSQLGNEAVPARAVVVETVEAWRLLSVTDSGLILLPGPNLTIDKALVGSAVCQGHHVVTRRPYTSRTDADELLLPRAWRHDLEQALTKAGFREAQAVRWARESGGSLDALQRLASPHLGTARPPWAEGADAAILLPMMLAGAWDDRKPADQAVIERLTGQPFAQTETVAARWLNTTNSPLRRRGTVCQFISREDAWLNLAPHLTRTLLETFIALAREVLTEDDPRATLAPGERVYAGIRNQLPRHSFELREGLAETVALLGTAIVELPGLPAGLGESSACGIVRALLPKPTPSARWYSLAPLLQLLAEAAPDEFLTAVEQDAAAEKPPLLSLFVDGGMFAGSQHHYLMWALEILAWHPDYLARTVLLLARLKAVDPGGNSSPRPGSVLRGAFRFWFPQSGASPEARFQVIDLLLERSPEQAWELLIGLLPHGPDMAMPAQGPRWREWPATKSPHVTYADIHRQIEWTAERLVRIASRKEEKLAELVQHLPDMTAATFRTLATHLDHRDLATLPLSVRLSVWEALRRLVRNHELYTNAKKKLPKAMIAHVRRLVKRFTPEAVADQVRWLFDEYHIFVGAIDLDHDENNQRLFELRRTAVARLLEQGGLAAALEFTTTVKYPGVVGDVLGRAKLWENWADIIPDRLVDEREGVATLARSYAWTIFHAQSWTWVGSLPLTKWAPEAALRLLLVLPFSRQTWTLVEKLGPKAVAAYWLQVNPWTHGMDAAEAIDAISQLLAANRALAAADLASSAFHHKLDLPTSQLAEILERAIGELNAGQQHDRQLDVYHLEMVFQRLQNAADADPNRVATLEWAYLPVMEHSILTPKFIHRELTRNPALFADGIKTLYRSRTSRGQPKTNKTVEQLAKIERTRQLIDSWKTHPCLHAEGGVDSKGLLAWINEVRQRCEADDRLVVCDIHIGRLLASLKRDTDGAWPCVEIRDILEELQSDDVLDGFHTAVINGRGIHSRGPRDGGQQERDLAAKYGGYADACRLRWPRVSAMLRSLAQFYASDARRMDERTEDAD